MRAVRKARGGGLKALAARLTNVASGAHRGVATTAYAAALAAILKVNVANHVKTGALVREAEIVIESPGNLLLVGPSDGRTISYMLFVKHLAIAKGFRGSDRTLALKEYVGVLRESL